MHFTRVKEVGLHPCIWWDPQPALCVPIDLAVGTHGLQPLNKTDNAGRPGLCAEYTALFK